MYCYLPDYSDPAHYSDKEIREFLLDDIAELEINIKKLAEELKSLKPGTMEYEDMDILKSIYKEDLEIKKEKLNSVNRSIREQEKFVCPEHIKRFFKAQDDKRDYFNNQN